MLRQQSRKEAKMASKIKSSKHFGYENATSGCSSLRSSASTIFSRLGDFVFLPAKLLLNQSQTENFHYGFCGRFESNHSTKIKILSFSSYKYGLAPLYLSSRSMYGYFPITYVVQRVRHITCYHRLTTCDAAAYSSEKVK